MNSGHWPRVEELFHQAAELAPAQRAAFLDNACAGDEDLHREVESLLAHDASRDDVLGLAVGRSAVNAMAGMEGRELRGYKLIREIGTAVWDQSTWPNAPMGRITSK